MKIAELDDAVKKGRLSVDGKIVINSVSAKVAEEIFQDNKQDLAKDAQEVLKNIAENGNDAGVEVNVSKVAFEHVWMLDQMAKRLGVSETLLRRSLFEDTGGMCACTSADPVKAKLTCSDHARRPGTPNSTRSQSFPATDQRR